MGSAVFIGNLSSVHCPDFRKPRGQGKDFLGSFLTPVEVRAGLSHLANACSFVTLRRFQKTLSLAFNI